jgi:hypothetical protein
MFERVCVRLLHDASSIKRKPPARAASANGVRTAHPVDPVPVWQRVSVLLGTLIALRRPARYTCGG